MKKPIHRLLLPALLLSCSPLAFAGTVTVTTINFNPNGTTVTAGVAITNQFPGATFTNATEQVAPNFDNIDFPPGPGSIGEAFDSGSETIGVSFSGPVNFVSGLYADPFGVVVTAFGANGTVLGTFDGATIEGSDDLFSIGSSSNIDAITISDEGEQLAFGVNAPMPGSMGLSQLTFAETPEPGSFLMLGTGLLTMAGVLRRKFAR